METTKKTLEILREAEKALADCASAMAGERDYNRATAALALADEMKQLVQRAEQLLLQPDCTAGVPPAPLRSAGVSPASVGSSVESCSPSPLVGEGRVRGRKSRDYPKFFREGDSLVKVGWSKREKGEYEHKSPKAVLSILAAALAKAGERKRRFTMDDILPLKNPADGSELPDYQVYVCLAWLRHAGLVTQHGRKGYSIPKGGDLVPGVEKQWQKVPQR